DSSEVLQAIKDATPYLSANPRKIKRFINAFRLQALIANRRGLLQDKTIDISYLGKWTVIAIRWPQFLGDLATDPELLFDLTMYGLASDPVLSQKHGMDEHKRQETREICSRPQVEKWFSINELVELLTVHESFKGIHSRDYLHLSGVVDASEQLR
ncbi:MAG TPA: hypothetical protein VF982_07280, partial [Anaerolineales bacterium]